MNNRLNVIDMINITEDIAIYGAGFMGSHLYKILSEPPFNKKVSAFIVKSKSGNPEHISQIKVISIEEADDYKKKMVLVALHEGKIKEALKYLEERKFENLVPVSFDGDLWCDIREIWLRCNKCWPFDVNEISNTTVSPSIHVYVVHSKFDKKLNECISNKKYEIPIQVGTEISGKIPDMIYDNTGDNISKKNSQYCELTGLYWAWKNDDSDFIGLCHYRRRFVFGDDDIATIKAGEFDLIVTVPVINLLSVKEQYIKDHSKLDWAVMTEAVRKLAPDYIDALVKVENNIYYFAYNMFIAKRTVFNDYCSWLFPILEYCEKNIGVKEDVYQNRYVGFLAERLLTIYIAKHTELKIVVAKKHFIE